MSRVEALRPQRVLVIDDNVDAADSMALLLTELGQTVRKANDGRTALLIAAQFRPHVVLVDLVMPSMDGFEVANALRDMTGMSARIIAITGYGGEYLKAMTAADCFNDHLVKPASVTELARVLAAP